MERNVTFISNYIIEFTSNGRRIKRLITPAEKERLLLLLQQEDAAGIDSFCYKIA